MTDTTTPHAAPGAVTTLLLSTLDKLEREARAKGSIADEPVDDGATFAGEATTATAAPIAGAKATLGALVDSLDEQAYGLLLLLFALPCCVPFLWGIPQIVALPMLALAAQLAMGREAPWLPSALANRPFDIDGMRGVVRRAQRYLGWAERLSSHRLAFLTEGKSARLIGLLLLIPTASILVPLPSTNTAPGIGVAIASIGLLERDGVLTILGLLIGIAWVIMLVAAFVFFGAQATDIIKDFLLNR